MQPRSRAMQIGAWIAIGVAVVAVAGVALVAGGLVYASRTQPTTEQVSLGVSGGQLTPCPETPNCVSTQADPTDEIHYAEPIPYSGSRSELVTRLAEWIEGQDRAELVEKRDDYIRAVFTSQVFRFHDDVELYFPEDASVVHVRSASRAGQGDLGVNRKRYEAVRQVVPESGGS
jgi:uncharacterized protein (DUF1499 family)